jgi:uncharacterized protein
MSGLSKRILINSVQYRSYRHGGKLLLLLAAFVTLSLILSVVGTGEMPGTLPVLFAQTEDVPPPLGGPPASGPFNGTLAHPIALDRGQINVQDFDAEARFFNPYPTTSGDWAYGFWLRFPGDASDAFYEISIDSNGNWIHSMIIDSDGKWSSLIPTETKLLNVGTSDVIDTSEGGSNLLKLMVRGDRGWLYINNQLAVTLDLRHSVRLSKAGDVGVVASGSLSGETRYEGFMVWAEAKVVPMGGTPMHGPVNVTLGHEGNGKVGVSHAEVNVQDFDAEARFFNPYPTARGSWTYGFLFVTGDVFFRVTIDSKDTSDAIDKSDGGSNLLRLIMRGDTGWLYINNQFASTLALTDLRQAGAVFEGDVGVVASGSLSGETQVEGFTVWAEAKVVRMGGAPVYGPVNGALPHNEDDQFEWFPAGMNVQDFDAEVRFFNPYPTTRGPWNYGFAFRRLEEGTFYVVLVDSDGNWRHDLQHIVEPLHQGTSDAIDTSDTGSNLLRLVVRGDRGWFYINDQLAGTLDLSAVGQAGDVQIVTGYIAGAELPGEATGYRSFTVWGKEIVSEVEFDAFKKDIGEFWSNHFAARPERYTAPQVTLDESTVSTPCGPLKEDNAMYCSLDHTIHVQRAFLQGNLEPSGDMSVGATLAHEWAHAAQQQLGIRKLSEGGPYWTIQKELQADCLSGVYIEYAIFEGGDFITIEPGDIQEAAIGTELAGDDRNGRPPPQDHPEAHGTGQQRVDAFYAGFNHGFAACWKYTAVPGVLP